MTMICGPQLQTVLNRMLFISVLGCIAFIILYHNDIKYQYILRSTNETAASTFTKIPIDATRNYTHVEKLDLTLTFKANKKKEKLGDTHILNDAYDTTTSTFTKMPIETTGNHTHVTFSKMDFNSNTPRVMANKTTKPASRDQALLNVTQQKVMVNFTVPGKRRPRNTAWKIFDAMYGSGQKLNAGSFLKVYEKHCESSTPNRSTHSLCPCVPQTLQGRTPYLNTNVSMTPSLAEVERNNSEVEPGGYWKPADCFSRDRVAIVIPFRDRQTHLNILLKYLHPLLQRQQIEYRIFVVEQAKPNTFNKAALMNSGFLEVRKLFQFDCVVFHDVDMIPEDDRNFYSCLHSPRHVAGYNNKVDYRVWYTTIFGGAVLFKPDEFELINGFSNMFYGWGGEDDEMSRRVWSKLQPVYRYSRSVARYTMLKHSRDKRNPKNWGRLKLLRRPKSSFATDGLNSLKYNVSAVEKHPLYTWIYVDLPNKS